MSVGSFEEMQTLLAEQPPSNLQQLLDTEKAYDRALQDNLDLTALVIALEKQITELQNPSESTLMDMLLDAASPEVFEAGDEELMQGDVILGVAAENVKEGDVLKVTRNGLLTPWQMGAGKTAIYGPALGADKTDAYDSTVYPKKQSQQELFGPTADVTKHLRDFLERIKKNPLAVPLVEEAPHECELRSMLQKERRRKKKAIGDRANIRLTLDQSQKANRRHKARIQRLEAQAETHIDAIEKLAPVYSKLLELVVSAMDSKDEIVTVTNDDVEMINRARLALGELANRELR